MMKEIRPPSMALSPLPWRLIKRNHPLDMDTYRLLSHHINTTNLPSDVVCIRNNKMDISDDCLLTFRLLDRCGTCAFVYVIWFLFQHYSLAATHNLTLLQHGVCVRRSRINTRLGGEGVESGALANYRFGVSDCEHSRPLFDLCCL